ncbi:MAG: nucleotidyltransferase domain-containing protein [Pseudomonadota bacterium]
MLHSLKSVTDKINISWERVEEFCKNHHIRRLSFFGSILTNAFGPESDVDVLVEFERNHVPGFVRLAGMERELSLVMGGRKVDMRTKEDLSQYFRDDVIRQSEVIYAQE